VLLALPEKTPDTLRLIEKLIRRNLFINEERLRQFIEVWLEAELSVYFVSLARVVTSLEKVSEKDGFTNEMVTLLHKWIDNIGYVSGATEAALVRRVKTLLQQYEDMEIQAVRREISEESLPHREFLAPILESPEDPNTRLVYADWLEEAGDPRSAAMRGWSQRKHLGGLEPHYDEIRSAGWDDKRFEKHFDRRARQVGVKGASHIYVDDHGGPVSLRCGWSVFVDQAEKLLAAESAIVCFRPDNWMDDAGTQALTASGWLEPMLVLDGFRFKSSGIAIILSSETACHSFREIILASRHFSDETLQLFQHAEYFGALRTFRAKQLTHADRIATAIASNGNLGELHTLILQSEDLGLKVFQAFEKSRILHSVRRLELQLTDGGYSSKAIQHLVGALNSSSLAALSLAGGKIKDVGVRHLSKASVSLRELNLSSCELSAKGVRALLSGLDGSQMERLILSRNPIGDAGLAAICEADLPQLKQFVVDGCGVTEEGLEPLASAPFSKNLQWLDVSDNHLEKANFGEALALPALRRLDASRSGIQSASMATLDDASLPELTYLNVGSNPIRDAGAKVIADATQRGWKLRFLQYDPRYVKEETKKRFEKLIPTIKEYKW